MAEMTESKQRYLQENEPAFLKAMEGSKRFNLTNYQAKDDLKKYQSIYIYFNNQKRKEARKKGYNQAAELLKQVRDIIRAANLTESDIKVLSEKTTEVIKALAEYKDSAKKKQIEALERELENANRQREKIENDLKLLKGE